MHFNTAKLILFSIFITGLVASPIVDQEPASDYVEHYRQAGKYSGTLIYYGPANGTAVGNTNAQSLQEREACGTSSKTPICATDHAARNDNCVKLENELYGDASFKVQQSPRQICYLGDSGKNTYCCVSWAKEVETMTKGDLAPFVNKIVSSCTENGISGRTPGVHLVAAANRIGNKCNTICVSNRGTHCS